MAVHQGEIIVMRFISCIDTCLVEKLKRMKCHISPFVISMGFNVLMPPRKCDADNNNGNLNNPVGVGGIRFILSSNKWRPTKSDTYFHFQRHVICNCMCVSMCVAWARLLHNCEHTHSHSHSLWWSEESVYVNAKNRTRWTYAKHRLRYGTNKNYGWRINECRETEIETETAEDGVNERKEWT